MAFDLDGTLVKSVPDLTEAINGAVTDLNLNPVTKEQVAGWTGNGVEKLVERVFLLHLAAPDTLKPQVI